MTRSDVEDIFSDFISGERLVINEYVSVEIEIFLDIFEPANPTKQDLLDINNNEKGYRELIESGNYS